MRELVERGFLLKDIKLVQAMEGEGQPGSLSLSVEPHSAVQKPG